ncbi:hypothetical protein SCLCIDRAFT_937964 [Scleroderma citrinum Foug A]|uniref:Uncharacterized protein n=1 Tax=Scleroderma citrinum Foug A TaxID=1036808 RepID=A0A0C3A741_9AGAM|nr:hypothetical protein SCLCIDRAFT_937964 [Scleroderma citrinum Foug A]
MVLQHIAGLRVYKVIPFSQNQRKEKLCFDSVTLSFLGNSIYDLYYSDSELPWIEDDRFGTFPVTNRGIQIWLFLRPIVGSDSVFQALLPCRRHPWDPPVAINLALWESNYYRYPGPSCHEGGRLQLRRVYLRYQDTPHMHRSSTFEIDDGAMHKDGLTSSHTCPVGLITGKTVTLSTSIPLCQRLFLQARV